MVIYHWHHIIPRHMGGTDEPENLVQITLEKHIELHRQLWEDLKHPEDLLAWQVLSKSSELTDEEKILISKQISDQNKDRIIYHNDILRKNTRAKPGTLDENWVVGYKNFSEKFFQKRGPNSNSKMNALIEAFISGEKLSWKDIQNKFGFKGMISTVIYDLRKRYNLEIEKEKILNPDYGKINGHKKYMTIYFLKNFL